MRVCHFLWRWQFAVLCSLALLASCSDSGGSSSARQKMAPQPAILTLTPYETQILVGWENPVTTDATLLSLVVRWSLPSFADEANEANLTIKTGSKLATGSQQILIRGLMNNTRYRVEVIGYYQRLEQICNADCNICFTAQRETDDYYEALVGEGETTTGLNLDNAVQYREEPPPQPPSPSHSLGGGEDSDGDGTGDSLDPDDDGNGLIEIANAAEFNNIRYALDGSGKAIDGGEGNLSFITSGCEGLNGTTACYGYELTGNISLAAYASWTPFALDRNNSHFPVIATAFKGRLDGRGYSITDLFIYEPSSCVGLFGNAENAAITNLNLFFTNISGVSQVGSLIGRGENVTLSSVFSEGNSVRGGGARIGGLVGRGIGASIRQAVAHTRIISGLFSVGGIGGDLPSGRVERSLANTSTLDGGVGNAGGLIGFGYNATVIASSAYTKGISGITSSVGGLIGNGYGATVVSSSTEGTVGALTASQVGGLLGDGRFARVYNSSASSGSVEGFRDVGGLIGSGHYSVVNRSFAIKSLVRATEDGGGLIGDGEFGEVFDSYASVTDIYATREAGGLIGDAENAYIASSYARFNSVRSDREAGGLVADGEGLTLFGVYAEGDWVQGAVTSAGGLVGFAPRANITDSHATMERIRGKEAGGLVGRGDNIFISHSSYNGSLVYGSDALLVTGGFFFVLLPGKAGGLVGQGSSPSIQHSTVRAEQIISDSDAGGLVGEGADAIINASSAHTRLVYSDDGNSGGLVARGDRASIVVSFANSTSLCGGENAAGLVASGDEVRIYHSYARTGQICNARSAGGLIGRGDNGRIAFSYAENGVMEDVGIAAGLIGRGSGSVVRSSYAASGTINASNMAGGLIGMGDDSILFSNYATVNRLQGRNLVGGLVAQGGNSWLVSSYAKARLVAPAKAGGLIGEGDGAHIITSYAAVGPLPPSAGGLIGASSGDINASYWDLNVSGRTDITQLGPSAGVTSLMPSGDPMAEHAKTTFELQQPTGYAGIYASWANTSFILRQLDNNLIIECDRYEEGASGSATDFPWDFGNSSQYPALRCVTGGEARQRIPNALPVESFLPQPAAPSPPPPTANETLQEDLLIGRQWYLDRIGVKELWRQNITGAGVHISIVDDALDFSHPDLIPNIVAGKSRNYMEEPDNPFYDRPEPFDEDEDGHGTSAAGIMAARGDNGIGIKGVAPQAGIYLSNLLLAPISQYIMDALTPRTNETLVVSNSWGANLPSFLVPARATFDEVVVENLKGKGVNYVFSAGNTRASEDMASYEERLNHRGVITVCAVGRDNRSAPYSNQGPNLWLCAPSGNRDAENCRVSYLRNNINSDPSHCGLATTDLVLGGYNPTTLWPGPGGLVLPTQRRHLRSPHWNFGGGDFYVLDGSEFVYLEPVGGSREYHRFFSGTSAAVPVVSGVIALLRSAYPELTWRDVKLILAESAEKIDIADASWQPAARGYHNNSRFYNHSIDYGFGLIDAAEANRLAKSWQPLPPLRVASAQRHRLRPSSSSSEILLQVDGIDFIEWTEIELESEQDDFGDMELTLVSPLGTRSLLTRTHECLGEGFRPCPIPAGFTFATAANLGQPIEGIWRLEGKGLSSDLFWQLRFYGHRQTN